MTAATVTRVKPSASTVNKFEDSVESYRVWNFQATSALRMMILEINSSRQIIWNFLREIPPTNGSSARAGAKAVHGKLARAETDLMYAIDFTEDSFRAFGSGPGNSSDAHEITQSTSRGSRSGNGQASSSGKSSSDLTMSKVKSAKIPVINFLDDGDFKEWTNLVMGALRVKVTEYDNARYELWRYSREPYVQHTVRLLGRSEASLMSSLGNLAAGYRTYVTRYHNVKSTQRSRGGPPPVRGGRRRSPFASNSF